MGKTSAGFGSLCFWIFVIIKVAGTSLATWSWLWLFLPFVPVIVLILKHFNLL